MSQRMVHGPGPRSLRVQAGTQGPASVPDHRALLAVVGDRPTGLWPLWITKPSYSDEERLSIRTDNLLT